MVSLAREPLDLVTSSETLIDRLVEDYGLNLDRQLFCNSSIEPTEKRIWTVIDLDRLQILKYLDYLDEELSPSDSYELRESHTGKYVRVRMLGEIIDKPDRLRTILWNKISD